MSTTLTWHWKGHTDSIRETLDVKMQPDHILVVKALIVCHKTQISGHSSELQKFLQ